MMSALDTELPLGISPSSSFSALDRFHRLHRAHRAGVLIAFCTKNCWLTDANCESLLALFAPACDLGRQVLLAC